MSTFTRGIRRRSAAAPPDASARVVKREIAMHGPAAVASGGERHAQPVEYFPLDDHRSHEVEGTEYYNSLDRKRHCRRAIAQLCCGGHKSIRKSSPSTSASRKCRGRVVSQSKQIAGGR